MNHLTIIGNLTRDPELNVTQQGVYVCNFTVAVNRRKAANAPQEADYFRCTVWRQLGENCHKYLAKGRKVCVMGPVSARTYQANDGSTRVSLEITADEVEFLSPANTLPEQSTAAPEQPPRQTHMADNGWTQVTEDLPF